MHPSLSTIGYTPFCDLFVGNFVLVQLSDPIVNHVWMKRAKIDVVKDQENENYIKVYVQWWVPMRKGAKNDEELYHNCWLSKWNIIMQTQKNGLKYLLTFSFSIRSNTIVNSIMNINATHAYKAKANFDVANNNSYAL
jgi:hypothetical protein